uniref:Uncharacterized protein n=1 Tax=Arundo donax TaxID=35708 RepID=A0A0A9BBW1_ARUDO
MADGGGDWGRGR